MTHGTNDVEDAAASEDESGNEGDAEEMQGWKVSGSFFNIPKQDIIFLGGQEDQRPGAAPIDAPLEDASNDASVAAGSTDEQLVATSPKHRLCSLSTAAAETPPSIQQQETWHSRYAMTHEEKAYYKQ